MDESTRSKGVRGVGSDGLPEPADVGSGSVPPLFEFAPLPCLVLSDTGEIRAASRLAGEILGADPNTLVHGDLTDRLAPASRLTLRDHLRSVIEAKGPGRCDLRVETADGRSIWVRLASRPLPPGREWGEGVLAMACEIDDLIRDHEPADPGDAVWPQSNETWDPSYGAVLDGDRALLAPPTRSSPSAAERAGSSGPRLLVVDDEQPILSSTARILGRMGYEISVAEGAHQALALFEREARPFELVITDHRMPGLSGLQLAERLHAMRPDLPIVLVSGYTDEIDVEAAVSVGIREMLSKPLTASDFEACLDRIVETPISSGDVWG